MKPTDEAKRLSYEIVDYIERQDDPQLCAEWIMDKVLDAVEEQGKHHIEYILAHTSDDSMTRRIGIDVIYDYIGNINKLRP